MDGARIALLIARHGQAVTLRFAPDAVGGAWFDVPVVAHVMGYAAQALVDGSGVQQGDRQLRVSRAALDAAGAPRVPRVNDRVVIGGETAAILSAEARALRGAPALIVCQLRGA